MSLYDIYNFVSKHETMYKNFMEDIIKNEIYDIAGVYQISINEKITDDIINDVYYYLDERDSFMGAITIQDISKFRKQQDNFNIILKLLDLMNKNKIKID